MLRLRRHCLRLEPAHDSLITSIPHPRALHKAVATSGRRRTLSVVVTIRRLGLGDEAVIATLAKEEAAFDIGGRGHPRASIGEAAAADYLADEEVLHWVGEEAGTVVGHLLCYVQRRRASDPLQLMLYEIGVRKNYRRHGVGRALIGEMEGWMTENRVASVWVLADNDVAEAFYTACGFSRDDPQPVQMSRRL